MQIELTQNYIFIQEDKIQSGTIVLPESKLATAWIITHLGPEVAKAKIGDRVLLNRGQLQEHRIGDETYRVIRESDIQAYLR